MDTTKWKLPFKVDYVVDYPVNLEHDGQIWWRTGKTGKRFDTGFPCAEYESDGHDRVWLVVTGDIYKE